METIAEIRALKKYYNFQTLINHATSYSHFNQFFIIEFYEVQFIERRILLLNLTYSLRFYSLR